MEHMNGGSVPDANATAALAAACAEMDVMREALQASHTRGQENANEGACQCQHCIASVMKGPKSRCRRISLALKLAAKQFASFKSSKTFF